MLAATPGPLDLHEVLVGWQVDPLALPAVAGAGALYLRGVLILRSRGRRWPVARTAAFGAGLVVVLLATASAIERYEDVLFTAHALQHTLLGMAAPPLLALGAPVTLALQAARRSTQRRLLALLHSRPVLALTHPLAVWSLFSATLVALYFSPLLELSLRDDAVHALVHLHFLLVGFLFFWIAVGTDPLGRRISSPVRALFAFSTVPVHAIVGLGLVTSTKLVAGGFYGTVARSWGPSALADQHAAGGILWTSGDLIGVAVLLAVVVRWLHHEQVLGARLDRRLETMRAEPGTPAVHSTELGPR